MAQRRLVGLCTALLVLLMLVLCRVYWIGTDTAYAANAGKQIVSYTPLPQRRGDFYDRNGTLLTGMVRRWFALCIPGDSSYATLFPYVPYAAQSELYQRRNSTAPFLIETGADLSREGIYCYAGAQRYLPLPVARHLLGYLDGEGHGVAGLEAAYDDLLYEAGNDEVVACVTTARGLLMTGTAPTVQTRQAGNGLGVRLTLDLAIQRAAEGIAAQTMRRGCILILDVESGEVLASVSMPEFDPDDIAASIEADDTSLINRALATFSAGSVFKVVLAAAAYEAGLDWYTHDCQGSVEIGGQTFRCALGRAHGLVNLRGALEASCNCYFAELGNALGAQRVLQTARKFGFGSAQTVAAGLKGASGELPTEKALEDPGQLAMLSFGQGGLTVTPLQIAAMMNVVAGDGIWRAPRFVQGLVTADSQTLVEALDLPDERRVCDTATARVLRSMLRTVVEEGTGDDALPLEGGAGGKTGTAQTGQYDAEGRELLNHWFSGFWPAAAPRYTITVMQDGMLEPEVSSAEIFARLANVLVAMERRPEEQQPLRELRTGELVS